MAGTSARPINPFIGGSGLSYHGRPPRIKVDVTSFSLVLFVFVAITITNAALVDYRSSTLPAGSLQVQVKAGHDRFQTFTPYLQTRKYAGFDLQTLEFSPKKSSWRGITKSLWIEAGLCCGVFGLLVQAKGGCTRVKILQAIQKSPGNRLELAHSIGIDWKAVDRHIDKLLEFNLVRACLTIGTSTVFCITDKGTRALSLMEFYHDFPALSA